MYTMCKYPRIASPNCFDNFDYTTTVGSPGGKILGSLKDPNHPNKDRGKIIVTAEELIENKTEARHGF